MHTNNVQKSRLILKTLRGIKYASGVISYLKKIDPYVCEEVVISSLEDQGFEVARSPSYSGDGGMDGAAIIYGKSYIIQTKRYSGHISKQHMEKFISLCKHHGVNGLFVHTGKTGRHTRRLAKRSNVIVVSGDKLVGLIKGKRFGLSPTFFYYLKNVLKLKST
jgi:restriction system protein